MDNFNLYMPTRILFGKGSAKEMSKYMPKNARVLLVFGGGSVKKNGAYDDVRGALKNCAKKIVDFGGIEPNPEYETCLKAVEVIKKEKLNFVIALGGGSVIDACKFIVSATMFKGKDPWTILSKSAPIKDALPLATVLTIPATGSEMNPNAVISRRATNEKLAFFSDKVIPQFSVCDPCYTFTLPERQTRNGIVDAFAHVLEQYATKPNSSELQDRIAEGILQTLIEFAPKVLKNPTDYDARANIMFCATMALNKLIASGVIEDWSSHGIGHELTALFGIDHGQSLAIVFPKLLKYKSDIKAQKIAQLGERVFGIKEKSKAKQIDSTINAIKKFFQKIGVKTELKDYKLPKNAPELVAKNIARHIDAMGENMDITPADVQKILEL